MRSRRRVSAIEAADIFFRSYELLYLPPACDHFLGELLDHLDDAVTALERKGKHTDAAWLDTMYQQLVLLRRQNRNTPPKPKKKRKRR